MDSPVLFVKIGWMKHYAGPSTADPMYPRNAHSFRQPQDTASAPEQWNFAPYRGKVYGCVADSPPIQVERLGARKEDESVSGVLAVFIARDPLADVIKVVGWYQNATVLRTPARTRTLRGLKLTAAISAGASEAYVIPVAARDLVLPDGLHQPGRVRSPVWYADQHSDIVERVRARLKRHLKPHRRSSKIAHNPNPEYRRMVDLAAMDIALAYFGGLDVSGENWGWDIEAPGNGSPALIGVKGLAGPAKSVELSANEYSKMQLNRDRYLLFVVSHARSKTPRSQSFKYQVDTGLWTCESGEILVFNPLVSARADIRHPTEP
ncbi:DUF3883 domain-containing protein [Sinimarinibacterium sp. CAU 1509]|uniref:DUF3883 domain-containing protein n=1 Tax=Sinimarinibacterium sp. CAU 1509 TaxID=2562283 RepID=UPI001B7FB6D8|nr:DUF3883 domain-containing protein [Sinimarinibacterium sp. CAU 1509]